MYIELNDTETEDQTCYMLNKVGLLRTFNPGAWMNQ